MIAATFRHFRKPGGSPYYCASLFCRRTNYASYQYHYRVGQQLADLTRMTGKPEFARLGQILRSDAGIGDRTLPY
ncbi:hypothetical protein I6B53_04085 [Schaalia sp. 19OD2882]|uniref:hypothetical protein n=1 Tax=Schaalia sp. 19OD2882 TaxID=2794089 RepID=UPI001C1ED99E|nr:hypothetical protein [Schaalia sp. 19OD2882]QWW20279.1 hypothetical protein I6B53_04085 [Schaalia sp. 19OD2882]